MIGGGERIMGMPNAYRCEVCGNIYFSGDSQGHLQLQRHYEMNANHDSPVPDKMNAYQCHHTNCGLYASNECQMIEHYRNRH